ncbi:MAG TPA: winged helix DNA-binding domain-containing protein [Actinomycetota bacterium]|nr:winged helix DNA-binding domain-containing protein [Actinomycetota bacterium]
MLTRMPDRPPPGATLGTRVLNRSYLARQLLLDRVAMPAAGALEHLVGMQAQAPLAPYVGLWSRLDGFDPAELAGLIESRAAVRIALFRSTIFLVTAEDCRALRAVVQPAIDRSLGGNFSRPLAGVNRAEVAAVGRALVDEAPRSFAELGTALQERWPGIDPLALGIAVRAGVPLVQVPPRGIWGSGGLARHAAADTWLGCPMGTDPDPAPAIHRYLAAFGPATLQDIRVWSGLPGLAGALGRLAPALVRYRDDEGRELWDVPDGPFPDPDHPAPVRLLPEYDNALLSHADRRRIIADEHRGTVFSHGAVLVDGFAAGHWALKKAARNIPACLTVTAFAPLPAPSRAAVEAEAGQLLRFALQSDQAGRDTQGTIELRP